MEGALSCLGLHWPRCWILGLAEKKEGTERERGGGNSRNWKGDGWRKGERIEVRTEKGGSGKESSSARPCPHKVVATALG